VLLSTDTITFRNQASDLINNIFEDVDFHNFWKNHLISEEHFDFFNKTLDMTLKSLSQAKYIDFDAHTTSNCCHGIATLTRSLILSIFELDLSKIRNLQPLTLENINEIFQEIPYQILALMGLYILAFVGKVDPRKGRRTCPTKLKEYSSVGTKFSKKIVRKFQKLFSNGVALGYLKFFEECDAKMDISSLPLSLWGKYIQKNFLRTDFKNIYYAPCLYSMQIILAFLITSRAKVVIINDLMTSDRKTHKGRYLRILQGDGANGFKLISSKELSLIEPVEKYEPVIVFGGCACSDSLHLDLLSKEMDKWLFQFSKLILACDVHYPEFPKVLDDPSFDSSRIPPKESILKNIIQESKKIPGTSSSSPSFFFLTHVYPTSLGEILEEKEGKKVLPLSSIFSSEMIFS